MGVVSLKQQFGKKENGNLNETAPYDESFLSYIYFSVSTGDPWAAVRKYKEVFDGSR